MLIGRGRWIGRIFKYVDWAMRSASVVVGAVAKTEAAELPAPLDQLVTALQQTWVAPAVLILAPVAFTLRTKTDRSRLEAVHRLLDQMCEHTFGKTAFAHEQHRRVTLFKHKGFCIWRWPFFGGWLVPIERSGSRTRRTDAIFRAPDDGERCEGVAGMAWSGRKTVYVPALPNLKAGSPTNEDFTAYGAKSFCDAKKLRRRPPQSRSLYGIPVEVGNKMWGVIVVDCVNEGFNTRTFDQAFKLLGPSLSSYLKGT